ncbi:MAG: HEAT repeat domain-containing protein [Chlamydiae bacterium]|nr:HEAT repeat domain-containing protein [Chlamydiota bacterium]
MDNHSSFPIADMYDHEILMHRDIHFGGSFDIMLKYYEDEGKGSNPEFEISRIKVLQKTETINNVNLSEELLDEDEQNIVKQAKQKYQILRDIYEDPNPGMAKLIADLILSEDIEAEEEIDQLVKQGKKATDALIEIISNDDFFNPLYPGYGLTPIYAAKALGLIKDERSIPILFETLSKSDFFTEETILEALQEIGHPAQDFLLKILKKEPFTKDNELAATALLYMPMTEHLSEVFFEVLTNPKSQENHQFTLYLVLGCEGLKKPNLRQSFKDLIEQLNNPEASVEAEFIIKSWK